jgi:ubiquinone/menaquinone biosynthesis C-methylase UbiE
VGNQTEPAADRAGAGDGADIRRRRGSSFGAAAAAYAQHRPDYAEAAVRWALEPVADRAPLRVLDLAAGTGKLTATIARIGAEVTAVEPDQSMLAELRRSLPEVRSLAGRAEQIPLPDGSVDAVLVGQAMHWFDLDRAMPEIARVLAPGGVVAGLWNVDDDRVPWVAELAEISKNKASPTLLGWQQGVGESRLQHLVTAGSDPGQPGDPEGGAGQPAADGTARRLFHAAERREFEHGQPRTADSLLATIATHSHLLVMDEADRARLLERVSDFLHTRPETASGEFVLPMVTVTLRALRR